MAFKLRGYPMYGMHCSTAALREDKTKCDHFPFLVVEAGSGVVVAKAVVGQPAVDIAPQSRSIGLLFFHARPEQSDLFVESRLKTALFGGCALWSERQCHPAFFHDPVGGNEEIVDASDTKIGGCLIYGFLDSYRVNAAF